jgi:tetratricopeptide (TPR) repeat protein
MFQLCGKSIGKMPRIAALALALAVAGCGGSADQRAQNHYEQGSKFLAAKDYVKARIEFKNAVQFRKGLVAAWRGLAQIEEQEQNWAALVPVLRTIVELEPNDIDARLRLARIMLLANSLDEALKLVDAALALDENHVRARVLRAAILLRQNDSASAVREAQKVLDRDTNNSEALIVLAAERMQAGNPKEALAVLDRVGSSDQANLGIQLFRIQLFEQLGDLRQVETLLRSLAKLYPQEPLFRRQLVRLYVAEKKPDEAEKELREISNANPDSVQAGLDVVRLLNTFKGPDAAVDELQARIKSGKQVLPYQIALAEFYFTQGKATNSFDLLERLIKEAGSPEDALVAQTKLAELHLARKNFDVADKVVAAILQKDNRNINALRIRAMVRMERGEYDPAIADLRQALNDQPRAVGLMSLLAIAYERAGSIELAEKQFAEAMRASGANSVIGLNYVSFLQRRGSASRAEDVLNDLAVRWPRNTQILTALAQMRLSRQDWVGAQEVADSLRRLGNAQALADQISGTALSAQNKLDDSIRVFQEAYSAAPNAVPPMVSLVRTYLRAGQADKAVAFLDGVLKNHPSSAEALVLMGSAQLAKNAPAEAVKSFNAAIEKQPKHVAGYRALAAYHMQQKNADEALKVLRAGLDVVPSSSALRLTLASAFETKGDFESAIKEYETLLADEPGSMVVANNLASLLADYRTDQASLDRAFALAALLRKSPVPQFKDTLGWVHYQRKEYKTAVLLLEEAAEQLSGLAMVQYHLGMAYKANGQDAKAAQQLKKALELAQNDGQVKNKILTALDSLTKAN